MLRANTEQLIVAMLAAAAERGDQSAAAADADQARSRGICQRRRLQDIGTSEKLSAKTIRRIVVKLMGFAVGNERAVFHDANLVRQGQGFSLIVGDVENGQLRQFAVQTGNFLHHVVTDLRIQRRERLIKQQYPRTHGDGASNCDALLLAAGKLVRIAAGVIRHADDFQGFLNPFSDLRFGLFLRPQAEGDVIFYFHVRKQGVVLNHHTKAALIRRQMGDIRVAKQNSTTGRLHKTGYRPQHRGFPGARRADQRQHLTGFNG